MVRVPRNKQNMINDYHLNERKFEDLFYKS
jgi:hypothetical protein